MKNARVLNWFLVAFCGSVAIGIKTLLKDDAAMFYLLLLPPLGSTVAYVILFYFGGLFLHFEPIRHRFKDEAIIEGHWLEDVKLNNKQYYTFFTIYFDCRDNNYKISGDTYADSGDTHAIWTGNELVFEKDTFVLNFFYDAKVLKNGSIRGHARLKFNYDGSQLPQWGIGYFVDMGQPASSTSYKFLRITPGFIQSILGDTIKEISDDNRADFVKKYHAKSKP